MTIIAWDGKNLAADKLANVGGLKVSVTKIKKSHGCLLFSAGDFDAVLMLYAWYVDKFFNCKPDTQWPEFQKDKDQWQPLHVITSDRKLWRYERHEIPFQITEPFYACGSGRDYAIAGMSLGLNALDAVELACKFDPFCGLGVDALTLGLDT